MLSRYGRMSNLPYFAVTKVSCSSTMTNLASDTAWLLPGQTPPATGRLLLDELGAPRLPRPCARTPVFHLFFAGPGLPILLYWVHLAFRRKIIDLAHPRAGCPKTRRNSRHRG